LGGGLGCTRRSISIMARRSKTVPLRAWWPVAVEPGFNKLLDSL
jgi:hypothetical protein